MVESMQTVEDEIYDQQYKWIKDNKGKKAAEGANYGWSVDETGEELEVSTKVYGHGVLTSRGSSKDNIRHDFQPF